MSDAASLQNGAQAGGAGEGSATTVSTLPGWTAGLSKEQKEAITSQKVQLPEKLTEFWDAHSQLEAKLKTSVVVPRKEDPKEVWDNYRKATGVPLSKDGYAFDKPELPKGMVYDEKLTESFAQWAHDEGLSATAAKNIFAKFNAVQVEQFKSYSAEATRKAAEADATRARDLDAVRTDLRTQWGETYDARMPRNMAALQNPMMVPADVVAEWNASGVLRKASFHLWWDRQVAMMSNDRKLGIKGEEGEGIEEENKTPPGRLPEGMFKDTAKRYPARKKAS